MKSRLPLWLVQRCVSKSLRQPIFHFSLFIFHFSLPPQYFPRNHQLLNLAGSLANRTKL